MIADKPIPQDLSQHARILGICWLLYGILRIVTAAWLVLFANTATVMFGALLNRVPDPFTMMSTFHLLYGLLVAVTAVGGILGVLAGAALLADKRSGRTIAIIAAFLSLASIPLGTTLGIYSLIVLLGWSPERTSAAIRSAQIPDLKRQASTI
jgi:hypothetical protein